MATSDISPTADSLLEVERTLKDRLAYMGRFLWRDKSGIIGLLRENGFELKPLPLPFSATE